MTLPASSKITVLLSLSAALAACPAPGGDDAPPNEVPQRSADGALCSDDGECASGLCAAFLCRHACVDNGDCADGAPCETLMGGGSACGDAPRGPDQTLGPLAVAAEGELAPFSVTVPDGVVAFSVTVLTHDTVDTERAVVGVASVIAPDGTVIVDDDNGAGLIPAVRFYGASTVLVPGTDDPAARVQAGTYQLSAVAFNSVADDRIRVAATLDAIDVWFVRAEERGGVLELVVHLAPGLGIPVAEAGADPSVIEMIARTGSLLSSAGVMVGRVSFVGLPDTADVIDTGAEVRALSETQARPGDTGRAVNVLFTTDLTFAGGISGGIPGPPGVIGSPASGIVIEPQGSGSNTGLLLAHELGHTLGLRHPTDVDGSVDAISDSPECASGTEIQNCPDYANLMFPLFPLSSPGELTEGQRGVAETSPFLAERDAGALCGGTARTVDISALGRSTGNTAGLDDVHAAACGGEGSGERAHLLRVTRADLTALEVRVTATGFAPVVSARTEGCSATDGAVELGCVVGSADTETVLRIEAPAPGPLFIIVDGAGGAGRFALSVVEEPEAP